MEIGIKYVLFYCVNAQCTVSEEQSLRMHIILS